MSGDLHLSMLLTAKADQARGEIAATTRSVQELGRAGPFASAGLGSTATAAASLQGAVAGLTRSVTAQTKGLVDTAQEGARYREELDDIRAQFNPLFAASRQYEQALRDIAEAEALGALNAAEAAAARERAAAGLVPMNTALSQQGVRIGENAWAAGNLAAQFNDIAVMSLAMQNPLQLAFQQGTQINQVFAGMGGHAAGLRAIGAAALSMVSPLSLATLGVIALGAYGVQWLLSLRQEAESVEDALAALREETEALREATRMAGPSGLDDLEERYGRVTGQVLRLVAARERLALIESRARLESLGDTIAGQGDGRFYHLFMTDEASGVRALRNELDLSTDRAEVLRTELMRLREIREPEELANQYASLAAWMETVFTQTGMTDERRQMLADLVEAEELARQVAAILEDTDSPADTRRVEAMQAEIDMAAAIARYGEDARIVTELRVAAERAAFEESLRALNVSEELKAQMLASWDAAKGLAAVDMASGIARARAEAQAMADEVMRALSGAQSLAAQGAAGLEDARIRAQYQDPAEQAYHLGVARMRRVQAPIYQNTYVDPQLREALEAEADAYGRTEAETARLVAAQRELAASRRDGAGATEQSREKVAELIVDLQTEIDLLRQTDPVQQEMIRQRGVLAGATAAERAEIEALIRTRLAEQDALRDTERAMEGVRDLGRDVLRGIVADLRAGASAGDILANVLDKLADKLIDMGTSSLADILFGGSGSSSKGLLGGFLGSLFGIRANAMGDVVGEPTLFAYGDGRGLGVMGEAGAEAIMPLTHAFGGGVGAVMGGRETTLPLTRLASGKLGVALPPQIAAFAKGDAFGPVPRSPALAMAARSESAETRRGEIIGTLVVQHSRDFEVRFVGQMRDIAINVSSSQIDQYDRAVLPSRVGQIAGDPALKG